MSTKLTSLLLSVSVVITIGIGCAGKKFQSPIVFRSPVVEEKSDTTLTSPPPPRTISSTGAEEQGGTKAEGTTGQVYETGTSRPTDIPVLSSQELSGARFSVLGRVSATSPDKNGFSQEKAIQSLKVEAFKHYGTLAQGLANLEYTKKKSLFSKNEDFYQAISGDVVTLSPKAPEGAESPTSSGTMAKGETKVFSPDSMKVLSSDDLVNLNFRILGTVSVQGKSRKGFTEDEAINALKIEAFTRYGEQAKGITSPKFKRGYEMFRFKKGQALRPPEQPKGFTDASAEVVSW